MTLSRPTPRPASSPFHLALTALLALALLFSVGPAPARTASAAPSPEHRARAGVIAERAIAYLLTQQDPATGGWAHNPAGPNLPAISGLVLTGLLLDPRLDWQDEPVARGIDYVLAFAKPDGSIHDGVLPTYNTAINLSMLSLVPTPQAASAIQAGLGMLRRTQWGAFDPALSPSPEAPDWTEPVGEDHPFFGGVGYGNNGRPDLSNLQFFLQAFEDAGVSADDPAVQRALTFLRRVQMDDRVNPMPYASGSRQGGFIYATVPNAQSVDEFAGQSQAGSIPESLSDGTTASRLRAYGSMTYAGFKSLIYADLPPDDPRLNAALGWIRAHYTLHENPGLGSDGLYYYYLMMSRALTSSGLTEVTPAGADQPTNWADDLIDRLEQLQRPDGSFEVKSGRWLEDNPVLITAYALIAIQHARR